MKGKEREIARQWLEYASGDLKSAVALNNNEGIPMRNVCYFAEQSVEKTLKALWIYFGITLIRTHDLDLLANKMPDEIRAKLELYNLSWLSEWSVEARYPGDWPEATEEDARKAIGMAQEILDLALIVCDLAD